MYKPREVKILEKMTKEQLVDFILSYSNYIIDYYEDHEYPDTPVCVMEYYDCEFKMINKKQ